jgi:diguanylate cyclase (GGDEF)-like protein
LEYESTHDPMTDCRNRRYFDQCLRRVDMDRVSSVAVLVADLKGLKLVNDTFGHAEGDRLIFETACILRECVRRCDTVARLGGDEFGVLFEEIDKFELLQIVRQIRAKANKWRKQKCVPVGLSIGYAIDEQHEVCSSHLLMIADKRMYLDKNKDQRVRQKSGGE